jgi:anti-sigma B factor antagonist
VDQLARLTIEEESGLLRACLDGEVDMSNAALVRRQLDGLAAPQLVLDLSGLVFFDSSGIRMVLELWRKRLAAGQSLSLVVGPDSPVRRVLTVAEVDRIVPVHPSWGEAVAQADGPSAAR